MTNIIGTTSEANSLNYANIRYLHYDIANARYWAAYWNGSDAVLAYSADGITWNDGGSIFTAPPTDYARFVVHFQGSTIFAVWNTSGYDNNESRSGTLGTSSVSWNAQKAFGSNLTGRIPRFLTVDSAGYPIFVSDKNEVWRNSQTDMEGTWAQLNTTPLGGSTKRNVSVFPINDAQDLITLCYSLHYTDDTRNVYFNIWDNSATAWAGAAEIVNDGETQNVYNDNFSRSFSAVKLDNGEVHFVHIFQDASDKISHWKYSGSWTEVVDNVTGLDTHTGVCLAKNGDTLYLFYDKGDNKIYYRTWTSDGGWSVEVNFKTDATALQSAIIAYYEPINNEIAVAWVEGASADYDVKIKFLSLGVPSSYIPKIIMIN